MRYGSAMSMGTSVSATLHTWHAPNHDSHAREQAPPCAMSELRGRCCRVMHCRAHLLTTRGECPEKPECGSPTLCFVPHDSGPHGIGFELREMPLTAAQRAHSCVLENLRQDLHVEDSKRTAWLQTQTSVCGSCGVPWRSELAWVMPRQR